MFTGPWSDERPHPLVPLSFDFIPMTPGLVSIILPSLNALEFLVPRIESILKQTYHHWEAIVLDSHSDDGTWEYFQEVASTDARFKLHRVAREGLYAALNQGIQLAAGDFIYIATCDDTMDPRFLEVTIAALWQFPEADLAVTDLQFIDSDGSPDDTGHYGNGRVRTSKAGEVMASPNLRLAPHDCLLHLSGDTVYFSLTQILARTSGVREAPPFATDMGAVADFGWVMNLCRSAATVHIPERLATWRHHGDQLSFENDPDRMKNVFKFCQTLTAKEQWKLQVCRRPFTLSARLFFARLEGSMPRALAVQAEAILILTALLCAHPLKGRAAWKSAGFGANYLKLSWISFLLNLRAYEPIPVKLDPPAPQANN